MPVEPEANGPRIGLALRAARSCAGPLTVRGGKRSTTSERLSGLAVLATLASAAALPAQTIVVTDAAGLLQNAPNLTPGSTLLLEPGTYQVPSLVLRGLTGQPNAWITIRGRGGAARIVGTAAKNVVDISDCAYLRFEDLEITCSGAWADIDGVKFAHGTTSHHVTLDGCRIHDVTGNGVSSQAASLDRLTLHQCEIARVRASGVYLGYDAPLRLATNTAIRNCWLHDVAYSGAADYGIQIKGGSYGARIENNVLHDVQGQNEAAIAVYFADAAGRQPPERWNVIRNNVLWRCANEGIYAVNSAVIENNVLFDMPSGIVVTSYGGKVIDNLRIVHNTVFRCSGIGIYLGEFDRADATCSVANNAALMARNDVQALRAAFGVGAALFTGNACYGVVYGPGLGIGVRVAAPPDIELTNAGPTTPPEQIELTPRAGSSLQDCVDGALGAARDVVGTRRPRQPGADAGAFEQDSAGIWQIAPGFKPSVDALGPLLQEVAAASGGTADFALDVDAPGGTWLVLFLGQSGPSVNGLLPVVVDDLTLLPFVDTQGSVFSGYVAQLGSNGHAAMQMRLPPFPASLPIVIYHGAVLVPPSGAPWSTNTVRLVIR